MTRRLTRCPAGRPLWRSGEIPDGLATVTRLRLLRRRLTPGQEPVATLLYNNTSGAGWSYTPLYEIAATVELPPLPPVRQARWLAARTCTRCAQVGVEPLEAAGDGRRRCSGCLELEARAAWQQRQNTRRIEGTAWAREVLAAGDVVLIAEDEWNRSRPLSAAFLRPGARPVRVSVLSPARRQTAETFPEAVSFEQLRQQIEQLAEARRIGWSRHPLYWLAEGLRGLEWGWPLSLRVADGDEVSGRYCGWLGDEPGAPPLPYRHRHGANRGDFTWIKPTATTAAAMVEQLETRLRRMAADDHPDGPPVCPTLGATGTVPCGAPATAAKGLCGAHDAVLLRRPLTPPTTGPGGRIVVTVQRICNGCGAHIGDATPAEAAAAERGGELPDIAADCPACTPDPAP